MKTVEKIQLTHPEGKKAIAMDKQKYDALRTSFLVCLKKKKVAPFDDLALAVKKDLEKKKIIIEGNLAWNLFSVTLDLVAKKEVVKDRTSSPIQYSINIGGGKRNISNFSL
jgi:predicted transcriptional regulator